MPSTNLKPSSAALQKPMSASLSSKDQLKSSSVDLKARQLADAFEDETVKTPQSKSLEVMNASIQGLAEYLEGLYETVEMKIKSTAKIRALATANGGAHLPELAQNDSLMAALARVLIDDGKKSMDLCINILQIFLLFAINPEYHALLMQNRTGDTTMKIIQRELSRFELWRYDIFQPPKSQPASSSNRPSTTVALSVKSVKEKVERIKMLMGKQDDLLAVCFKVLYHLSMDVAIEIKMVKRDIVGFIIDAVEVQMQKGQLLDVVDQKARKLPQHAQPIIFIHPDCEPNTLLLQTLMQFLVKLTCFRENNTRILEAGTKQKSDILQYIFHVASKCENIKVQMQAISVLCNLNQTMEMRKVLVESVDGYVDRLASLMNDQDRQISRLAARLAFFASSFAEGRKRITQTSIIANAMKLLLESKTEQKIMMESVSVLCNMAQDPVGAAMICGLSDSKDKSPAGLKLLMKKAFKHHVAVVWKLLRILAASPSQDIKMAFLPFIDDMMNYCRALDKKSPFTTDLPAGGNDGQSEDANEDSYESIMAETEAIAYVMIIGILGSLEIPEFDYAKLNDRYKLLELTSTFIQTNINFTRRSIRNPTVNNEYDAVKDISQALEPSDDMLLECLHLLGTMLQDSELAVHSIDTKLSTSESQQLLPPANVARPTAASGRKTSTNQLETTIPQLLLDVLQLKQDDAELTYQTLRTIYSLVSSSTAACEVIIKRYSNLVDEIAQLLWDPSDEVHQLAEMCLSQMEYVEQQLINFNESEGNMRVGKVGRILRERRFQYLNADWVFSVQDDVLQLAESYDTGDTKGVAVAKTDYENDEDNVHRLSAGEGLMMSKDEVFEDVDGEEHMLDTDNMSDHVLLTVGGQQLQFL